MDRTIFPPSSSGVTHMMEPTSLEAAVIDQYIDQAAQDLLLKALYVKVFSAQAKPRDELNDFAERLRFLSEEAGGKVGHGDIALRLQEKVNVFFEKVGALIKN